MDKMDIVIGLLKSIETILEDILASIRPHTEEETLDDSEIK